jgi:hypothetical protein
MLRLSCGLIWVDHHHPDIHGLRLEVLNSPHTISYRDSSKDRKILYLKSPAVHYANECAENLNSRFNILYTIYELVRL